VQPSINVKRFLLVRLASVNIDGPMGRASSGRRLSTLYLQYATGAKRLAYLLTGDEALAEDIVHDAFIRLAGRLVHFRSPVAFDAYLRRTIVNLARSNFRRRRIERRYLETTAGTGGARILFEEDFAAHDVVKRALMTLPYRQRAALVLRFYNDLSVHEIADVLGAPSGTVKSLLSRGLSRLRQQIGSDPGG
jgi:RNA polymerase sigma-70 factor (sigma-E family)